MRILQKASRFLFKALEWFAIICMVVLTVIVFTDVILRYIFKQGFPWTQEVATLMLVWFSLIGLAIGALERIHISIEMFTSKLPAKVIRVLESIDHILIAVFGGAMVYYGLLIMNMTKMSTLPATKMPSSVLYVILPLSGLLVLLNAILVAARKIAKPQRRMTMPDTTIAIAIMLGVLRPAADGADAHFFHAGHLLCSDGSVSEYPTGYAVSANGQRCTVLLPAGAPFFILAGEIMGQGGISRRLITLANACVGWMRGGLAQVNILASMFFGGISGSAVADTSSIGSILIPMMTDSGYDKDFSVAVTVTSSCQGVMIPPSHNMILFAMAAGGGVSIGQLFMGGLIPGILLGVALMIITAIIARKRNYPKGRVMSLKEIWKATKDALLGLMTCIIIVGGVILGWFTATESAAVAVVYAFIVTFFVYREIPLRQFGDILRKSLRTIAMVMALISTASMFGWLLAYLKVPTMVTNLLLGVSDNKVVILPDVVAEHAGKTQEASAARH